MVRTSTPGRERVVIIGSGFGGLFAAKALKRANVDVTLIAKTDHHLFQPLLYQVATGILSQGEIAPATREILRRQQNCQVLLGEVTQIDLTDKQITSEVLGRTTQTSYDRLIVAAGSHTSYFGNDRFADEAPGLKSIDDALELRGRIFGAYELAELATDPAEVDRLLTFVVIGAGATGVEMAGQITELARRTLPREFRSIDPRTTRVVLADLAPQVLGAFGDRLSDKAAKHLQQIGVEVRLGEQVVEISRAGITLQDAEGHCTTIPSACKVWAAGVSASALAQQLAQQSGAALDRAGRIEALPDLTLPGHPDVHVVGDLVAGYPGVAQVAIQGGRLAAKAIRTGTSKPFRYRDKGSMATVSRFHAVASVKNLRVSGFLAWLMWLAVHLVYLVGFKNRLTTVLHWAVSFVGRGRSERVATEQQVLGRLALQTNGSKPANTR